MLSVNNFYNSGRYLNGFKVAVMDSAEKTDIIINDFSHMYRVGLDPNEIIDEILKIRNIDENDLMESDINRINRKIESIYKSQRRY